MTKEYFLDKHTNVDDILRKILAHLEGTKYTTTKQDLKVIYFSYPRDGTLATLQAGITTLDFKAGTIKDTNDIITKMNHSLRSEGREWLRSFFINSNKAIIIQPDSYDMIPVGKGKDVIGTHQEFTTLRITCTEATKIFVVCCTSPDAIIELKFESKPFRNSAGDNRRMLVDTDRHGQVDILSLIPGTGATNLGKEEDTTHVSGDVGMMGLAVRKDNVGSLCSADGDYTPILVNEHGVLRTQAQQHYHIDECEATTGWSVLGNDTINLAITTNHVCGRYALEFDKVNGAANTKIAGIQKTITSFDFTPYHKGGGFALCSIYLSSLTDVDYVFLRLGTDSSNYSEWRCSADDLEVGWNFCRHTACLLGATMGNGWNSATVTYVAVGAAFDAETDALADMAIDHIAANTGLLTSVPTEIPKNVNLLKVKNKVVNTEAGNVGTGTQRITIADDDTNLSAIKTAIEILDNFISGTKGLVTEDSGIAIKDAVEFSGSLYTKNFSVPDAANETSIEASAKKLKDVIITNTHATYETEIRESGGDWVELAAGRSFGFTLIDLNTMFVKAATDGENPVLDIIGVLT